MSENKQETRSASQRLTDVETNVGQLYTTYDYMTKDLTILKSAIKLLDSKLNALVKVLSSGTTVSEEAIDQIMVDNNVAELASKVDNMVTQGIVTPEESVSANSFVVGSESDSEGKVTNPRIQFALKALAKELQDQFLGKKAGETVSFNNGKVNFTLLKSYKIAEPEVPAQVEPQPTETAPVAVAE